METLNLYDKTFNESYPVKIVLRQRVVGKFANHTDTYFYGSQELLIVSFHGNFQQVELIRQQLDYLPYHYHNRNDLEIPPYKLNRYSFNDIKYAAKTLVANNNYSMLRFNCNHQAAQLIEQLYGVKIQQSSCIIQ